MYTQVQLWYYNTSDACTHSRSPFKVFLLTPWNCRKGYQGNKVWVVNGLWNDSRDDRVVLWPTYQEEMCYMCAQYWHVHHASVSMYMNNHMHRGTKRKKKREERRERKANIRQKNTNPQHVYTTLPSTITTFKIWKTNNPWAKMVKEYITCKLILRDKAK